MKKFFLVLFLLLGFGFSLTPEEERQLIRDIAEIKATLKAQSFHAGNGQKV